VDNKEENDNPIRERERPDPIWNSTSFIITHTTSLHLNANPHPIKTQIHKTANFHKLATPFPLSHFTSFFHH
ncbi:hypothetical protein SO802_011488, partial [Lithocarpus litseifolius]